MEKIFTRVIWARGRRLLAAGIYRVSNDSWGRKRGGPATLPPYSVQISESGSLLLRPWSTPIWLPWIVEGFGVNPIVCSMWDLKKLTFKPQAGLMGLSSLTRRNCERCHFWVFASCHLFTVL